MRLPSSYVLSAELLEIAGSPFAFSRYSDVFKGSYDGLRVCVKKLKVDSTDSPEKIAKGRIQHDRLFAV